MEQIENYKITPFISLATKPYVTKCDKTDTEIEKMGFEELHSNMDYFKRYCEIYSGFCEVCGCPTSPPNISTVTGLMCICCHKNLKGK